jgi:TRAP transporter TAXI family solute receptor
MLLVGLWLSPARAIELRLMTGPEQGTYHQIGQEISEATEPSGIQLEVLPSQGSWANIVALFNSETEFAIFQVDAFVTAAKNLYRNTSININQDIRVVMPLYREEIHVIKAQGTELNFADRKSFVIGCGPENSGSCLTAAVIAEAYDKDFRYVRGDYTSAIAGLKAGTLDLVIITAGKPYPLLVGQSGLELVSLPVFNKFVEYYSRTSIGPQDYPWLKEEVDSYAVRSVLATMIQEQEGLANDLVGSVHFSLRINESRLKRNGHPKWNDVQFSGYIKELSHTGAMRSLGVCNAIRDFGYRCTDMTTTEQ